MPDQETQKTIAEPNGALQDNAFLGVPVEVTISVGKAKPMIADLLKLGRGSVLPLNSRINDPVEIYIGDKLIAKGELQEMENSDRLGVRLTEVVDLHDGF